ncbi:hypothetical protein [Vibrio lentus]|uniref:hypothetical protein n=1 Tax=Vibrio lentus TaxID=136468 RepID=UPI0009755CDB|nr:hypothetical protein [Vibrio lentus]OMO22307.1 hypothetical protein BH583_09015 [Vibrio lentus]
MTVNAATKIVYADGTEELIPELPEAPSRRGRVARLVILDTLQGDVSLRDNAIGAGYSTTSSTGIRSAESAASRARGTELYKKLKEDLQGKLRRELSFDERAAFEYYQECYRLALLDGKSGVMTKATEGIVRLLGLQFQKVAILPEVEAPQDVKKLSERQLNKLINNTEALSDDSK